MPSVVKHSYLRGGQMKAGAVAHVNYILYRAEDHKKAERSRESENSPTDIDRVKNEKSEKQPAEKKVLKEKSHRTRDQKYQPEDKKFQQDRVKTDKDRAPARPLHSATTDNCSVVMLKKEIGQLGRNDVFHKFILSPGHNDIDAKAYTREVMTELGRAKGQENLNYYFVIHENTEHKHIHVTLLGRDKDNQQVRIDKLDHLRMRAFGDRFLEREHNIERVVSREMEEFCRTRNLNPMFERERGQDYYDRLYKGDKKKDRNATFDRMEWEKFNSDWKKFIELKEGTESAPNLGRSSFHDLGRISDFTALMNNDLKRQIWEDVAANDPGRKDIADEQLAMLEAHNQFLKGLVNNKTEARDPFQSLENVADNINAEQKAFQSLMKNGMTPRYSSTGIDLNQVDQKDKMNWESITYTKYDTLELLQDVKQHIQEKPTGEITKEDCVKLWTWVGAKERLGGDCYGEGPRHGSRTVWDEYKEVKEVIDLDKVEEGDKFQLEDQVYTKYDPMKELLGVQVREATSGRLSEEDSNKLWVWVDNRNTHGDDYYGQPPMKSAIELDARTIDLDRVDGEDKIQIGERTCTKFDTIDDLQQAKQAQLESGLVSESDIAKLSTWVDHKNDLGENCFGVPPLVSPGPPIDLDMVDAEDKITIKNHVYTKFDSIEDLNFAQRTEPDSGLISEADFTKLSDWIDRIEYFGEDYFGEPPTKNLDKGVDREGAQEPLVSSPVNDGMQQPDLQTLDDFTGLGDIKPIDYEVDFEGSLQERPAPDWSELDNFIATEPAEKVLNELAGDYAVFQTPYYPDEEMDRDRDDSDDLFSQGIH